jgi:hypothetical protein
MPQPASCHEYATRAAYYFGCRGLFIAMHGLHGEAGCKRVFRSIGIGVGSGPPPGWVITACQPLRRLASSSARSAQHEVTLRTPGYGLDQPQTAPHGRRSSVILLFTSMYRQSIWFVPRLVGRLCNQWWQGALRNSHDLGNGIGLVRYQRLALTGDFYAQFFWNSLPNFLG